MKGTLKLSLAVALALAGSEALALGLGMIRVRSGQGEPLNAEIRVTGGPDETGESVRLACRRRRFRARRPVALPRSRCRWSSPLRPAREGVGHQGHERRTRARSVSRFPDRGELGEGRSCCGIHRSARSAERWRRRSRARAPATAPVKETATTAAPSQPLPAAKPPKAPRPTRPAETETAAAAPSAPPVAEKPSRAGASAGAGEYGPVAAGETLWEVAASTRPDDNVTLNQVMIALHRNNPDAFFKDNINSLKRGAILRVPSVENQGRRQRRRGCGRSAPAERRRALRQRRTDARRRFRSVEQCAFGRARDQGRAARSPCAGAAEVEQGRQTDRRIGGFGLQRDRRRDHARGTGAHQGRRPTICSFQVELGRRRPRLRRASSSPRALFILVSPWCIGRTMQAGGRRAARMMARIIVPAASDRRRCAPSRRRSWR